MSEWVDVAPAGAIAPNQCVIADVDGIAVAVFNIDGEFFAIEDQCSHEASELADGEIDGDTITCPTHGAQFSLKSGEALSAPAYEPIATFPVRVEKGIVQVRDDRWD
ncbi:MAG: non-heme iron oxygenase ferredoxin subunit [Pseudomonadota bacterium]|nr:non-heme iron oxygenase ferredoxin subunit [Pseudomonadota bacterium]